MKPTVESVVAAAGELSALPDSWQRIDAVLAVPTASNQQIGDAIASDPGLTARLLRLANSPLFGFAQTVDRLAQAVHLVGTRQLRELALATTVIDMLAAGPGRRDRLDAFLRRSTATGLCARGIAARRREGNIERFLVLGLLHDIGSFVLEIADPVAVAEVRSAVRSRGTPVEQIEQERFGFDHAAVGSALLTRWRLPAALAEPVAHHHQPMSAVKGRMEAAVVHVAMVAVALTGVAGESDPVTPLSQAAWDQLGIDQPGLASICREVQISLQATHDVLAGRAA